MTDQNKLKKGHKKQFDNINQYSEKLSFFFEDFLPEYELDLNVPFLHWLKYYKLEPQNEIEKKTLVEWTMKYFAKHDPSCDLEKLKKDFNEKYKETGYNKRFIEYELKNLEIKYQLIEFTGLDSFSATSEQVEKNTYLHLTGEKTNQTCQIIARIGNFELAEKRGEISALYKDFLTKKEFEVPDENEKQPDSNTNESEASKTKDFINKEFETLDKTGWNYAFTSESDYNIFINLLTNFFEYKKYSLPKSTIKLKRDCKTRFAKVLRPIHKELSENNLKTDTDFFKIVKTLNHFKDLSDIEIYQAITR